MTTREDFPETCILVLISGPGGMATDFCQTAFKGKGLPVETMDAADPDNKEFRSELFEISGVRGNYPQVFRLDEDEITFIGEHQKIQKLAERGKIGLVVSGDYDEDDDDEESSEDEEETDEEGEEDEEEEGDGEEAEAEEEAPKKKGMFGMFGRKKKDAVTDEAPLEVEEVPKDEEEEAEATEKPKKKGMFGMFSKKKKEEVPEEENAEGDEEAPMEPEEMDEDKPAEEEKPKKKGMFGMFGKKKEDEETKDDGEPDFADVMGTDNINDPEAGATKKDDERHNYDESVTAAMRDFQEKNQGDKVKLYGLLIKFFSAGVCLASCAIIVIVVFIILN